MNKKSSHAGSTQKFTEIIDIIDDIVILPASNACLVIEVTPSNFALLSKEEQDAKVYAYAALLNSLSFPIQIIVQNKRVDISSYLSLLDEEINRTQNPLLASHIQLYRAFIQDLVKVNSVLDKNFYVVIPYSYLEKGAVSALRNDDFSKTAQTALHTKASALQSQLDRIGLRTKILQKEELVKVYYSVFNDDVTHSQIDPTTKAAIVKTMEVPT